MADHAYVSFRTFFFHFHWGKCSSTVCQTPCEFCCCCNFVDCGTEIEIDSKFYCWPIMRYICVFRWPPEVFNMFCLMREKQVPSSEAGNARREWKKFFFVAIQSHSWMCAIRIIAKNCCCFLLPVFIWHLRFYSFENVFSFLSSLFRHCDASPLVASVNCPSARKAWNLFVQSFRFFHFHSLSLSPSPPQSQSATTMATSAARHISSHRSKTNNRETKYDKLNVNWNEVFVDRRKQW